LIFLSADRLVVYERTETTAGIKAHMAEKDAWVCWTLRQHFALPDARAHFIFKGGTSLSKVWKVIHRFAEVVSV
jgi:predicted nucleotidyltransferase component of viral defense system